MLIYAVLVTAVFLALGFGIFHLLNLQRFTDFPIFVMFEGCLTMFFGVGWMEASPRYVRKPSRHTRFMSWVTIHQLRMNLKAAAIFVGSGLLILIIGLWLGRDFPTLPYS